MGKRTKEQTRNMDSPSPWARWSFSLGLAAGVGWSTMFVVEHGMHLYKQLQEIEAEKNPLEFNNFGVSNSSDGYDAAGAKKQELPHWMERKEDPAAEDSHARRPGDLD